MYMYIYIYTHTHIYICVYIYIYIIQDYCKRKRQRISHKTGREMEFQLEFNWGCIYPFFKPTNFYKIK
jgi:hypothetical protein